MSFKYSVHHHIQHIVKLLYSLITCAFYIAVGTAHAASFKIKCNNKLITKTVKLIKVN